MQKQLKKYFLFFTIPTLLAFAIAFVIPFLLGIFLSFTQFTTVTNAVWVGFANYANVFTDPDFLQALWFTAAFAVVSVITINLIAFLFALLLTRGIRGTNVFRTIFFMPNLIGGIVLGYIWQLILNGILYRFDATLTVSPVYGFWGLVILMNWQLIGYMMVIYIAGIISIPKELLEAGKIDGASGWSLIRRIVVPLVMPSVTVCLFLTISNCFKAFDQILSLTGGGPFKSTETVALDIYFEAFTRNHFGLGSAKAIVFFIIVAAVTMVQVALTKRREVEA